MERINCGKIWLNLERTVVRFGYISISLVRVVEQNGSGHQMMYSDSNWSSQLFR